MRKLGWIALCLFLLACVLWDITWILLVVTGRVIFPPWDY